MVNIRHPQKKLSWKMLEICNYRCSYCLQKEQGYSYGYPHALFDTINTLDSILPEPYEFKLAGGELFINPSKAFDIASEITKKEHWISICTNFSYDNSIYKKFIDLCNNKIGSVELSMHLEYENPDQYLIKCQEIRDYLPSHTKILINNIIPHGVENIKKIATIKRKFEKEGFEFCTDLLVDCQGKCDLYESDEKLCIRTELGHNAEEIRNSGGLCEAGNRYFIILPNTDAWTCWEAWYAKDEKNYLGNIIKNTFKLRNKRSICEYAACSCPTPLNMERNE